MMYQLIIRPEAEADIAAAKKWYSARQMELGDQFLAAVESVLDRISKSPEIHAPGYRDVRHTLLRRFPYVVYYRVLDDRIVVLAVLHGSRHP
jgi:plasmid stabilization system protein ParE